MQQLSAWEAACLPRNALLRAARLRLKTPMRYQKMLALLSLHAICKPLYSMQ